LRARQDCRAHIRVVEEVDVTAPAQVFNEVLSDLDTMMRPAAGDRTFKWTAQYLTREQTFYQFSGAAGFGMLTAVGRGGACLNGPFNELPASSLIPKLAEFTANHIIMFYAGSSFPTSEIFGDVQATIGVAPDIVVVEIADFDQGRGRPSTITNLAFVGLEQALQNFQAPAECILKNDLLHPFWCYGRRWVL
jgi:hypothetical protein